MTDGELMRLLFAMPVRELVVRLVVLTRMAKRIPIVRRADEAPFSTCLGCGSVDGDPCEKGCWVSNLEQAIERAERAPRRRKA